MRIQFICSELRKRSNGQEQEKEPTNQRKHANTHDVLWFVWFLVFGFFFNSFYGFFFNSTLNKCHV